MPKQLSHIFCHIAVFCDKLKLQPFGRFGGGFGRFFSAGILFITARLFDSARLLGSARLFAASRLIAAGGDDARVALIVRRRAGGNAEDAGKCHYKA